MRCSVYIATSLDGFIAGENDDLTFLDHSPPPEGVDYGWAAFNEGIDCLLMGSNTYRVVSAMDHPWPYVVPVFVATNSIEAPEAEHEGHVHVLSGTPGELVAEIERRGFSSIYVDGGRLITSFLRASLIDELTITRVPTILGCGSPLFGALDSPVALEHVHSTSWANGYAQSTYRCLK